MSGRSATLLLVAAVLLGVMGGMSLLWLWQRPVEAPAAEATTSPELPEGLVEIPDAAQRNAAMTVLPATSGRLPVTLEVTGTVRPDDARVAEIRPLARGLIESVAVRLGDRVQAGQPLVVMDNIELGELIGQYLSERAALAQTETDLEVRRRALARAEELIKVEALAAQTLDLRRAEFDNGKAAVRSQRARVSKIEEQIHRFGLSDADIAKLTPEEGRAAHRVASHNTLKAPFGGIITQYDAAAGEVVQPDRALFTLANLASVWVLADVYEKDLEKVQRGAAVSVRVEAYPDRVFRGELSYVSDLIDPATRTAKVRCVVANPDNALKLNMFARITIPTPVDRSAVLVPSMAVQQVDGRAVVFVRQSATRFERRFVDTGATAGDLVEVRGGVRAGEPVVAGGSFYLKTALLRERIGESE